MVLFLLLLLPVLVPMAVSLVEDPAPGVTRTRAEARNMDCTRLTEAAAHDRYPGQFREPAPRGDFSETGVIVCKGRIMEPGERPRRDEALLSELSRSAAEIAESAIALGAQHADKTWLVDAFYPDPAVAAKLAFATKTALVERGRRVSDRVPILASGDILVVGRMPPNEAYPLACARYRAEASMGDDEVLLAVVLLDARETTLHAGLCTGGRWRWLR